MGQVFGQYPRRGRHPRRVRSEAGTGERPKPGLIEGRDEPRVRQPIAPSLAGGVTGSGALVEQRRGGTVRDVTSLDPDVPEPTSLDLGAAQPTTPHAVAPEPEAHESAAPEPEVSAVSGPVLSGPATGGPLGDLVAAHFQRVAVALLARILTTTLAGALPAHMVRVERRRTVIERLTRRPGRPIGVGITAGDTMLTFRAPNLGVIQASVSHTVNGIVLSTTRVSVPEWLSHLAVVLNQTTADDQATRAALERALLAQG